MEVPMIDLRAQYRRVKPEIDAAVAEVFESQVFIGGPQVEGLERALAAYVGVDNAIAVASGTDALLLLLRSIGAQPGDEVITTAFSFFATAGAIANAGFKPVFADIDPETYNLDPAEAAAQVTDRTRAIMPVHLYGQTADMDPLMAIAQERELKVIEDAAQALGAQCHGRRAGALGHAAAVSFYPTKNLGGAGDGGVVLARDPDVAGNVRLLRSHGADTTYYHRVVGTNSRLDALQAAVLLVKLRYLDTWNCQRRERAAYYTRRLGELDEVGVPVERPGNHHTYHQYVIRLPRRDAAVKLLHSRGIGCAIFYPVPLHCQACFAYLGCRADDCPRAREASREVLALPIYPELTPEQQDAVVEAIKAHLAAG